MWNNIFEKNCHSTFLQICLLSGLVKDTEILIFASAFYLLRYIVLFEEDEENPTSRVYVDRKGGSNWPLKNLNTGNFQPQFETTDLSGNHVTEKTSSFVTDIGSTWS